MTGAAAPPTLLSWLPFAHEHEVAFSQLSPTIFATLVLSAQILSLLMDLGFLGGRANFNDFYFDNLHKLLAFSFLRLRRFAVSEY